MPELTTHTPPFKTVNKIQLGNRLLRRKEVEQKTGKSRSAIYDGIRQGTFPAPVPIGGKSVAWLEEEVDSWIAHCLEERKRQTLENRPAPLRMTAQPQEQRA
ncbi:helix-turn-helix transcriptional regulator [Vreelandella nanhaiensis]|uniref:AlpA family transcriptional regulator n=1 Tax=Vreelandella nanhaiensis TaxID=1258546 RepID=A0A3S0W467_9GAMM|nr:AlpA family transcriptional regulator [Halomonas nanhaiensis]RUR28071.1 AlpA family transcriptional regulator [Halomonas nanhaiensis]